MQQALLKLVEGTQLKINAKARKDNTAEQIIDTRNILFITGGAFAGLDKLLKKRLEKGQRSIGFHADFSVESFDDVHLLEQVQSDDLRQFGLIPEFIGRFPVITGLHDLDEQALVRILTEPRNALVRQYQKLFDFEGVTLNFTDDALIEIAQQAIQRGTGARGLRGVMEGLLRKVMFEMPGQSASQCMVDEQAVRGERDISVEL